MRGTLKVHFQDQRSQFNPPRKPTGIFRCGKIPGYPKTADALSPHRRSDGHAASISFEKGLHIDVVADSLFDVAFYQLSNLMYDDELELRVCPMCNAFFVPKHRNQKYCDSGECYPQKAYKREKAAEKQRNSQNSKA